MKILHINTSDSGGAAKALTRLHEGLLQKNVDSKVLTLYHQTASYAKKIYPFHNGHHSILDKAKYSIRYRIDDFKKKKLLKNTTKNYEVFSFPSTIYDLHQHPLVQEADMIHLHWVGNFLDYPSFFEKIQKPIVWTLHDLNPFSGGFHYVGDSLRNKEQFAELEYKNLAIKKRAVAQHDNLTIVCPSTWTKKLSQQSEVFKNYPHYHIPYGLDLEVFKPYNRTKIRTQLELPLDKKIILFVADNIDNQRKGFQYFNRALNQIKSNNFVCILVGSYEEKRTEEYFLHLDFIKSENMLAQIYACADVYIISSLEDNLPNTVLESLAYATPVIGSNVGGIPDMIQNGENGFLFNPKDTQDLAQKITTILVDNELRKKMGEKARKIAEDRYALEIQTQEYIKLYHHIIKKTIDFKLES